MRKINFRTLFKSHKARLLYVEDCIIGGKNVYCWCDPTKDWVFLCRCSSATLSKYRREFGLVITTNKVAFYGCVCI